MDHTDAISLEKRSVNWVNNFLCEDLPSSVRQQVRIFFYNYDSYWMRDAVEERRTRLGHQLFEDVTSMEVKVGRPRHVFSERQSNRTSIDTREEPCLCWT